MLCEKDKCTGCFACFNICPKNAITMEKDDYGNVYPSINEEKCIKCGLCSKVCPSLKEKLAFNKSKNAYAMHLKDEQKRSESTSGGAASILYKEIIKSGGVGYGVTNIDSNTPFSYIRIDKEDEIIKLKGTKYVHSYVNDSFKNIKKDLENKKDVLFIGTPCQVSGLKSFLLKEYDNLYTVDIICHGVPSQKLLFDELDNLKLDISKIKKISFRDEKIFNFKVIDKNNKIIFEKKSDKVEYYRNFLRGNTYRENCYNCRYAQNDRISDITIGDYWGLSKDSKVFDSKEKGISLIITNTEKGEKLINKIKEESTIEKRTLEEARKHNAQLNGPSKKTKQYEIYKKYYPKLGYKKTIKKMITPKDRITRIVDNNKVLNTIYKKVKKK